MKKAVFVVLVLSLHSASAEERRKWSLSQAISNVWGSSIDMRLKFGIVEQRIRCHRVVRLLGGRIEVEDAGSGRTIVRMATNCETSLAPAGTFRRAIVRVVRAMHSIVV